MGPEELDKLLDEIDKSAVAEPLIDVLSKELSLEKPHLRASLRTLIILINKTSKKWVEHLKSEDFEKLSKEEQKEYFIKLEERVTKAMKKSIKSHTSKLSE